MPIAICCSLCSSTSSNVAWLQLCLCIKPTASLTLTLLHELPLPTPRLQQTVRFVLYDALRMAPLDGKRVHLFWYKRKAEEKLLFK